MLAQAVETVAPVVQEFSTVHIDWKTLHSALKAANLVGSRDAGRPHIYGVLFDLTPTTLTLVATDGHRLLKIALALSCQSPDDTKPSKVFVPPDQIAAWLKVSPLKGYHLATMTLLPTRVEIRTPATVSTLETKETNYPPYHEVIPQQVNAKECDNDAIKRLEREIESTRNKVDALEIARKALALARSRPTPVFGMAGAYVHDLGMIAKLLGRSDTHSMACQSPTDELDPIRFDLENPGMQLEATYVLMPCRL